MENFYDVFKISGRNTLGRYGKDYFKFIEINPLIKYFESEPENNLIKITIAVWSKI